MTAPIQIAMDRVEMTPTGMKPSGSGLPYATHTGVLELAGISIKVIQLNTGERVLDADDVANLFESWGMS